jgi:rhamnogalacturonyl hydrolase YesR
MNRVVRLDDGTWARFHGDSLAVWADDLCMGSVILTRMAGIDNQPAYLDESVRQTLLMDRYLSDPASGLWWHGYFAKGDQHSSSKWGRGNGWTMMAKTELLFALPENHPDRPAVLEVFQRHAAGLLAVQSEDGRWHQVLDNPDTYLETSCTAMFTRAFAEGVRNGWLPEEGYRQAAEKGWAAIARQVREDGQIAGIVRGTPIFYSDEEYQNHKPRLNDPRGIGAVLYAASSMHRLQQQSEEGQD